MCPNPKNTLGGEKTSRKSRSVEERCLHYDLVKTKPTFKFHNGPDVFEHCDLNDEHDFENDYDEGHHFKDCLTKQQIDHLWTTGHCSEESEESVRLPNVGKEGLLFCDEAPPQPAAVAVATAAGTVSAALQAGNGTTLTREGGRARARAKRGHGATHRGYRRRSGALARATERS